MEAEVNITWKVLKLGNYIGCKFTSLYKKNKQESFIKGTQTKN